jgi:hypothetical protein
LQFEEFRLLDEQAIEVHKEKLEIIDQRARASEIESISPNVLIWAEGAERSKGRGRQDLYQADEFAIYTTPASPQVLHDVLSQVKPRVVHVFAVSPQVERTDDFLARLAGLAKYVINQRAGNVSVRELAAVTGQREGAVQVGLEWLAAGGHISAQAENGTYLLSSGNNLTNQYLQKELYVAVRGILQETAAYRAHFGRANLESLFGEAD